MALRQGSGVPQCNLVTRMPLATIALFSKQTTDNFGTCPAPELPIAIHRVTGYYLFLIVSLKHCKTQLNP